MTTTVGLSGSSPASSRAISSSRHTTWPLRLELEGIVLGRHHAAHAHRRAPWSARGWPHCAWPCRGCPRPARRERSGSPAGGRRSASRRAPRRPRRSRRTARPSPCRPFISALVRRSTKRWVSCSCRASDRLSSIARVRSCQCSWSASQSTRLDTKVQVRMWAMRLASVSMSPSVRSASATCWANQSSGMRSSGAHQELVERGDQLGVVLRRDLAVVGDLADVPQAADGGAAGARAR